MQYSSKTKDFFKSVYTDPFFAEIDRLFSETPSETYPFHNIIAERDGTYRIELAVAGFKKDELEIVLEKNILSVKGHKKSVDNPSTYVHRGIATRQFQKRFSLGQNKVKVTETYLEDGILTIVVEHFTPTENVAQQIPIGEKVSSQENQLLTE